MSLGGNTNVLSNAVAVVDQLPDPTSWSKGTKGISISDLGMLRLTKQPNTSCRGL